MGGVGSNGVSAAAYDTRERFARVGAGSHCTVLKGGCVTPQKIAAASNFYLTHSEFRHLESMQALGDELKALQS